MYHKITAEILHVRYPREYDGDAGPAEILDRIREAVEAKSAVPCQRAA